MRSLALPRAGGLQREGGPREASLDAETRTQDAGLSSLAGALADAIAAERGYVAVLDGGLLRAVASHPEAPLPEAVVVASHPALGAALAEDAPCVLGEELSPHFGGSSHLVLPLTAEGVSLGAIVLADPAMPAEAAVEMLAGAVPLAAAHLATWREHRRALERLGEEIGLASALRQMVDNVGDSIRVLDLDGRVVRWNRTCERVLGWTEEEVLGECLPTVPPERRQGVLADLRHMAMTMEPVHRDTENVRKDGSRVRLSLHIYPFLDDNGEFRAVTISRELSADTRVDRLREQFCDLVSGAMKTPLTSIIGFSQLLRRSEIVEDQLRRKRVLDSLEAQAAALGIMIDDLLLLSEVQEGELRLDQTTLDLVGLVTECVAEAERACAGRRFVVDVENRLPRIPGDAQRLRQALAHLLSNAATYSPPEGEIWVTVAREGVDAVVSVRDGGEGIPAEDLPRVFERFFRGSRARGAGSGVGLHVVRLVAEAHDGTATIESAPDEGCRATLRLPLLS